jgi:hypothetical protein
LLATSAAVDDLVFLVYAAEDAEEGGNTVWEACI